MDDAVKEVEILLVEDNPTDAGLAIRASTFRTTRARLRPIR